VARQGDIVMFADKMDVLYNDEGEIRTIASKGNVKVIQGERIATGDKIIFFNQEQKIVVTGNPRVWQGDNVIQGKKITVFLKEDRSVIEGGPDERVNVTIYPDKAKP
jgi:lipopolysaccharide export system protein LptA